MVRRAPGVALWTVYVMYSLPSSVNRLSELLAPVALRDFLPELCAELPPPLLDALRVLSDVRPDGIPWSLAHAFDAACRELPCLSPGEWQVLADLERLKLLCGGEHERVTVGLHLRDLDPSSRISLEQLHAVTSSQSMPFEALAAVSVLLL